MRTIQTETNPEPVWVDLPDGGRLCFRRPTWEDRDRAVVRAQNEAEGPADVTDVTRELMVGLMVAQEGFGHADEREVEIPADSLGIVSSLSISDVRAVEPHLYGTINDAEGDLGN